VGSLVLAGLGSVLLARRIATPIETISHTLAEAVASRQPRMQLQPDGSSQEVDTLVGTFNDLMATVAASEAETERTYLGTIESLAITLEARDPYTAGHSQRVCDLSLRIGRRMGLSPQALEVLRLGSLFHDIGKIGVDDAVLRKPGRLTLEEFQAIRQHPTLGARILEPIGLLPQLLAIVEHHHERPDGRGYPLGLAGDAIPLEARIVHVADAFDAMVSARPYRPARTVQDAIGELAACRGTNFDPAVVDTCLEVLREAGSTLADENDLPRAG
jgi:putative nucleotidyltransferase with HDIG domain